MKRAVMLRVRNGKEEEVDLSSDEMLATQVDLKEILGTREMPDPDVVRALVFILGRGCIAGIREGYDAIGLDDASSDLQEEYTKFCRQLKK